MTSNTQFPHQFTGGGPTLLVRNTFIDVDEGFPKPIQLRRAQTAPGGPIKVGHVQTDDIDDMDEEEEDQVENRVVERQHGPDERQQEVLGEQLEASVRQQEFADGEHELTGMPSEVSEGQEGQEEQGGNETWHQDYQQPAQSRMKTRDSYEYQSWQEWYWAEQEGMPTTAWPAMANSDGDMMASQGLYAPSSGMYHHPSPGLSGPVQIGPGVMMHGNMYVPVQVPVGADGNPQGLQGVQGVQGLQGSQGLQGLQAVPEMPPPRSPRLSMTAGRWPETQLQTPGPPPAGQPRLPQTSVADAAGLSAVAVGASSGGTLVAATPPQPQTLSRSQSQGSGRSWIHWTVDARKLRGNDKQAVSPPFDLGGHFSQVTFKMMLYPTAINDGKGGASFKKARGRGYVQLKCEAELLEAAANVSFRIHVGKQPPRGPVQHNFLHSAVCGLPKEIEEWDFGAAVDNESMTFVVCLEIIPMGRQ